MNSVQWGVWLAGTGKALGWIPPQVCRKHQYKDHLYEMEPAHLRCLSSHGTVDLSAVVQQSCSVLWAP